MGILWKDCNLQFAVHNFPRLHDRNNILVLNWSENESLVSACEAYYYPSHLEDGNQSVGTIFQQ